MTDVGRLLVVMRHAKAEPFGSDDWQRELTDRGRRDAAAAGQWLAGRDVVVDHAFVSSAHRTRATWEELSAGLGGSPELHLEEVLYAAGPDDVLDTLRSAPADAQTLLYIGHNPVAAYVAHLLDDGDPDPDAFRDLSRGFPPAAMTVLEVSVPWADLEAGTARLVAFHVGGTSAG